MGLESACSSQGLIPTKGVLGWGAGEDAEWFSCMLPSMWQFSKWRTYSVAARAAGLAVYASAAKASHPAVLAILDAFYPLLRPSLMEETLDLGDLEAACVDLCPFEGIQTAELLEQQATRLPQEQAQSRQPQQNLGVEHGQGVLRDLTALAGLHRFWVTAKGPAAGVRTRQRQREQAGADMTFDRMRLDLSDQHAAELVSLTNPPGAPPDYLEHPAQLAPHAAAVSFVVCWRRWKALGVLELVVPLLFEVSHLLLREDLSAAVREVVEEFVSQEVAEVVLRRIAVWSSLNRSRPWEYDKIERGLEALMPLIAMPAAQLAALGPQIADTLVGGMNKLASSLEHALQQLTMRNNNDPAFTQEARQVCDRLDKLIEAIVWAAPEDEAEDIHQRMEPLMGVIDRFT